MSDSVGVFHKYGFLILLFSQALYLGLDVLEAHTENANFGIAAAFFMLILGILLAVSAVVGKLKEGHFHVHEILESVLYIGFAIALIFQRLRNKYRKDKEE